jgi:epoxyqueuosine reductase
MGNSHDKSFLPQLEVWALSEDEVLAEGARWAIRQITESSARQNPLHD